MIDAARHSLTSHSSATGSQAASYIDPLARSLFFHNFELRPEERVLLCDGQEVDLGGRAFDLLHLLVSASGRVVDKNQIFHHVWPSTIVDESNIRFQMTCLRRALGPRADCIKTVKGRGYILTVSNMGRQAAHTQPDLTVTTIKTAEPHYDDPTVNPVPALIAVVDDDDGTRAALEGLLKATGFEVIAFATPNEFLKSERRHQAQCLLLDVWMPGENGLDFQQKLVHEGLYVPIIFMSGHADIQMSVRAMKAGALEFLTKPVCHQDLLAALWGVTKTGLKNIVPPSSVSS